jgi:hypothetical protein
MVLLFSKVRANLTIVAHWKKTPRRGRVVVYYEPCAYHVECNMQSTSLRSAEDFRREEMTLFQMSIEVV